MRHDPPNVTFVDDVKDHRRAAIHDALEHERRALLRRRLDAFAPPPIVERLAVERVIPGDVRELHAPNVTTATIVQQIIDYTARDAVLEHGILQSLRELGPSALECPGWNEHIEPRGARGIWILIDHHIG